VQQQQPQHQKPAAALTVPWLLYWLMLPLLTLQQQPLL
jgi:hypothetical protein